MLQVVCESGVQVMCANHGTLRATARGALTLFRTADSSFTLSRFCAVDDNGFCQLKATAFRGENVLMTYTVDLAKQSAFVPPISASLVCECDSEYNKKVNIIVQITNNLSHRGVQHLSLQVRARPPPAWLLFASVQMQRFKSG